MPVEPDGLWILLLALIAIPWAILLLDSLLRAWLMLVSLLPASTQQYASTGETLALAAVVPARDEAPVIEETVARLCAQMPPGAVFVIADNCTDETAAVARRAGAQVWERREPDKPGKGAALRWFLTAAARELSPYDAIAIFDADSVVNGGFVRHAGAALAQGADAVQSFVQPLSGGSPAADLAAVSSFTVVRLRLAPFPRQRQEAVGPA